MRICKLTIVSSADEQTSKTVRMGKWENADEGVRLFYREASAQVELVISGDRATVNRQGDYSLRLPLIVGAQTQGMLCVSGSEGALPVYTRSVTCVNRRDGFELLLEYELLFGEERQRMILKITAQCTPQRGGKE